MSGIIRNCKQPAWGNDITTYTVDQLLKQAKSRHHVPEQLYGELERRARLWDKHGPKDMKGDLVYQKVELRARMWDAFGDAGIDKRSH